jgi:hypothetical protein
MGPASDGDRSTRPIADIDLAGVAEALGDNSGETTWWYDPTNGQVEMAVPDSYLMDGDNEDEDDPYERGLVPIEPIGSRDAYRDMVEFAESVADARASDLLLRALEGRGAFRRFRDVLAGHPAERERWLAFRDRRHRARLLDWLDSEGIEAATAPELPGVPEPAETAGEPAASTPRIEPSAADAATPEASTAEPAETSAAPENDELLADLTLVSLYLGSWQEPAAGGAVHRAWKGHRFEILDALEERGLISASRRAKSLYLTEDGVRRARELAARIRAHLES